MKFKRRLKAKTGIDLTAMIDVVFNLLIFFMIGTTIVDPDKIIEVNLAKAASSEEVQEETDVITVTVDSDGSFFLKGTKHNEDSLTKALKEITEAPGVKPTVIIRPDETASVENLVKAVDISRGLGLNIGIAVKEK